MPITAIILSGGRATRMDCVDKGLVLLQQKPLIQYVIDCLRSQTDEILINANREITRYQSFGYLVLEDEDLTNGMANFIGPLAGFSLGLKHAEHEYLLTVPCDSPLLPIDLADRLLTGLIEQDADIAVAHSERAAHPVFSLCKKKVLSSLTNYLLQGGRKVSAWQKSLNYIEVDFSDNADAFINLNTFEELEKLQLKLEREQ